MGLGVEVKKLIKTNSWVYLRLFPTLASWLAQYQFLPRRCHQPQCKNLDLLKRLPYRCPNWWISKYHWETQSRSTNPGLNKEPHEMAQLPVFYPDAALFSWQIFSQKIRVSWVHYQHSLLNMPMATRWQHQQGVAHLMARRSSWVTRKLFLLLPFFCKAESHGLWKVWTIFFHGSFFLLLFCSVQLWIWHVELKATYKSHQLAYTSHKSSRSWANCVYNWMGSGI